MTTAAVVSHPVLGVGAEGEQAHSQEDGDAGEAGRGDERQPPAALAPAVHRAQHVGPRQQAGTGADGHLEQQDRLLERVDPQHRQHAGGPEELPEEHAEHHGHQPGARDEQPERTELRQPPEPTGAQQKAPGQQQQPLAGVPEHHPEHHDEGDACQHGRVDVGVGNGRVGVDERGEGPVQPASLVQERRWIEAPWRGEGHHGAAVGGERLGQRGNVVGGHPAEHPGHQPAGHGRRGPLLEFGLAGQQVRASGPRDGLEISGCPAEQRRPFVAAGQLLQQPAGCAHLRVGRHLELHHATTGDLDQDVAQALDGGEHRHPPHADRLHRLTPRHRRPPALRWPLRPRGRPPPVRPALATRPRRAPLPRR